MAELRDRTLWLLLVTSLEEQRVQGCRLAQATLTNRLLVLAVISKKFHPCCIPGHHEALVFHQPQRILLPPKAASHWVTAGQCFSPKPLPSTVPFTQGEPLAASHPFSCIFWFPLSVFLQFIPFCCSLPCLHSLSLRVVLPGTGCISSSACPPHGRAFEIWSLKDGEGGSVLRPSPCLHCIYHMSWCLLAATGLLQMLWPLSSLGHLLCPSRGHLVLSSGCASCFFFL